MFFQHIVDLNEVFTPSVAATLNYVERKNIDNTLSTELAIPGKQLLVYGHSGSGKTSSILNLLRKQNKKYIITQCESCTTFEELLLNAFDELEIFVVVKKHNRRQSSSIAKMSAEYQGIKSSFQSQYTVESGSEQERILPPQLTPQKLAKFFGETDTIWIIEDFHKVSQKEKVRIADMIKIFVDNANHFPNAKIICIGATESAHELVQLDTNLKSRISEINIPLLSNDEIRTLVTHGFKLLNIHATESLIDKLVHYSDRLGSAAHQMCWDICNGTNINRTQKYRKVLNDNEFKIAIDQFISRSSGTFIFLYDAAIKDELGWYILRTISSNSQDKISFDELKKIVNQGKKTFNDDEIIYKIEELSNQPFDIIYQQPNNGKYALTSPFWHRFLLIQFELEKANRVKNKNNKKNRQVRLATSKIDRIVDDALIEYLKLIQQHSK